MAKVVRESILTDVKRSGSLGIIFDTTPDMSHREQMSKSLRYVTIEYEKVTYEVNENKLTP